MQVGGRSAKQGKSISPRLKSYLLTEMLLSTLMLCGSGVMNCSRAEKWFPVYDYSREQCNAYFFNMV